MCNATIFEESNEEALVGERKPLLTPSLLDKRCNVGTSKQKVIKIASLEGE